MAEREWVDSDKLVELNAKVKDAGYVDREDMLTFLSLVATSDATIIIAEVRKWLNFLHQSPDHDRISLPDKEIQNILGDLDSYGVVQSDTILKLKDESTRNLA